MSFHVKDNIRPGQPITSVGADWFNRVAGFLNSLVGGIGIIVTKNSHPSAAAPISIDIDPDAVRKALAQNETVFQEMETPSAVDDTVSAGHAGNALLETTWTRGTGKGVKVYLPTDGWGDGVSRSTAWRLCEFDRYGQLQKIYAQTIRTEAVNMSQLFG